MTYQWLLPLLSIKSKLLFVPPRLLACFEAQSNSHLFDNTANWLILYCCHDFFAHLIAESEAHPFAQKVRKKPKLSNRARYRCDFWRVGKLTRSLIDLTQLHKLTRFDPGLQDGVCLMVNIREITTTSGRLGVLLWHRVAVVDCWLLLAVVNCCLRSWSKLMRQEIF